MAKSSKLRVMISSRCDDSFPANPKGRPLSDIRKDLKAEVEALEVFGKPIVEVWINEDIPPQGGTWDSWDVCLKAVKDCDVLIALSNGNAGWAFCLIRTDSVSPCRSRDIEMCPLRFIDKFLDKNTPDYRTGLAAGTYILDIGNVRPDLFAVFLSDR